MEEALVSVVVPSYNRCSLLSRCIENLQEQSYRNMEIIVVNDGSQDNTEAVMKKYEGTNIRYYRYTPNRGACYARNYGVRKAKGEYIAFQDSDDLWEPEKLKEQVICLTDRNVDVVFCGMCRVNSTQGKKTYYPRKALEENRDAFLQLLEQNRISTQTVLAKRTVFDKVEFDPTMRRFQDWDLALQIAKVGYKIAYIPKPLVTSKIQSDSITATIKNEEAYLHILSKYEEDYLRNPKAYARILRDLAQSLRTEDRNKAIGYFEKSLKYQFDLKSFVQLCLFRMHIEM